MRRAGLLAVVALFVVAGCDAPTRPQHGVRVKQFDVNGSMQADGTVQMQAVVVYPSDDGGPLRLGAPTLGVVADVRLDNSPRSSSAQTVDVDPRGVRTGVDWAVRGASERYEDGVIVTLPIWTPPDDVSGDDQRVPVRGALQLPAPPVGKVRWHGASPADLVVEGASIRYSGTIDTTRASELSFLLPSEALPAAPALPGASRVASYESREASADASDARIAGEIADTLRREDLEANLYWGAVGLEVAIPFVITLLVLLRAAGVRRRATRDVPDELSDAPSDLAPAVVSLLHAGGQDIRDEAMAATILDLAHRRALVIEGITSERYTLKVVGSSPRRGEATLLAVLGQAAGTDGTIVGPPLPVKREGEWWRCLRRDVVSIAREAGLLRRRYPSGLFLTAVIALALTTLPLYARSPETVVAGIVVATILAALPFVGGYVLTGAGHRERARWEAYRRHLLAADFGDVPAPGVIVWENGLVYAAALDVATTAIGDLS